MSMTPDVEMLMGLALTFRTNIAPLWSGKTAYVMPGVDMYGPNISNGQCAVTSMMFWCHLKGLYPDLRLVLVGGLVKCGATVINDHVWLQIDLPGNNVIVDLTVDQASLSNDKVVCGTVEELRAKGLQYEPREFEHDMGGLRHPNRFQRYQLLKSAWEQAYGKK